MLGQLRVDRVSRTVGQGAVAVARHGAKRDDLGPAAYFGLPPDVIWVVERGSTWARSRRHEISETSAWPRGVRQRRADAVADVGDADAAGVEAERLGADHVARDPAVAALPDLAEAVDEVVVADVVPAVRLHVVGVDRAEDRWDVWLSQ